MTTFDEQNLRYAIGEVIHVDTVPLGPKGAMHMLSVKESMGAHGEENIGITKVVLLEKEPPPVNRMFAFIAHPVGDIKGLPLVRDVIKDPTAIDIMRILIKDRGNNPKSVSEAETHRINRLVHNF